MVRSLSPISLYIHVPFCTKKCPYCHFFVLPDSPENQDIFLKTLSLEWQQKLPLLEGKEVVSIYFGGGTPSLLSPLAIEEILNKIPHIQPNCEITLEVNPEKSSLEKMASFYQAGINRVSIGVQSFHDPLLHMLGRTHDSTVACRAITAASEAGIANISIDLMYELPHQTLADWEKTILQAAHLPITHVSLYNLTFEPQTTFYKQHKLLSPHLPSAEEAFAMLEYATSTFPTYGLSRYEISAFARDSLASVHNTGYWTGRPFLGLGPSAFSYIEGRRFRNIAHLHKWKQRIEECTAAEDFTETLTSDARQKELLTIHLRLIAGVHLPSFIEEHGSFSTELLESISGAIQEGYIHKANDRLLLTEKGLLFYDTVASLLI